MENKNTGLIILVIILSLMVVGLSGFIVYDKVLNNNVIDNLNEDEVKDNNVSVDNNKMYNYDGISGLYKVVTNIEINERQEEATMILYLYKNGTFKYEIRTQYAPNGTIGNYIIKDDKILLNDLFITGSDASIKATKGSKEILITDNETLTYNNYDNKNISIKLEKDNTTNETFEDINNMINGYYIVNATNSN